MSEKYSAPLTIRTELKERIQSGQHALSTFAACWVRLNIAVLKPTIAFQVGKLLPEEAIELFGTRQELPETFATLWGEWALEGLTTSLSLEVMREPQTFVFNGTVLELVSDSVDVNAHEVVTDFW